MPLSKLNKNYFLSALILITAIIFGLFIIYKPISLSDIIDSKIIFENYNPNYKKIDTDNDGLSDDEERLIGTNPEIADTDGDKFLDGEEIASGHNPLVAAPADDLKYNPLPGMNLINTNYTQELTKTFSLVARSFLNNKQNLMNNNKENSDALKSSVEHFLANLGGGQNSSHNQESLDDQNFDATETRKYLANLSFSENEKYINQKLEEMEKEIENLVNISIKKNELKIINNPSKTEIENYKSLLKSLMMQGVLLELKIYRLIKYDQQTFLEQQKELDNELNNYLSQFKKLEAPVQFLDFHRTIFSYILKKKILGTIVINNLITDPLKTLLALNLAQKSDEAIKIYLQNQSQNVRQIFNQR